LIGSILALVARIRMSVVLQAPFFPKTVSSRPVLL